VRDGPVLLAGRRRDGASRPETQNRRRSLNAAARRRAAFEPTKRGTRPVLEVNTFSTTSTAAFRPPASCAQLASRAVLADDSGSPRRPRQPPLNRSGRRPANRGDEIPPTVNNL
jgi:hypothetical protein